MWKWSSDFGWSVFGRISVAEFLRFSNVFDFFSESLANFVQDFNVDIRTIFFIIIFEFTQISWFIDDIFWVGFSGVSFVIGPSISWNGEAAARFDS